MADDEIGPSMFGIGPFSPENLPKEFMAHIQKEMQRSQRQQKYQATNNPADFPVAVKIEDDKILLAIAELDLAAERVDDAERIAKRLRRNLADKKEDLFRAMDKAYPKIKEVGGNQFGTGFRKWNGEYFYVGFNLDE